MLIRELNPRHLSPALRQYKEFFGHLQTMESLKVLTQDELEAKVFAAVEVGKTVESWKSFGSIRMGKNLGGFCDPK